MSLTSINTVTKVSCVAIIGKNNNPMFIKNYSNEVDELKFHYLANISCDLVEAKITQSKYNDSYLGLLYIMEDLAVYGYLTNTKIKIIIILTISINPVKDMEMKQIFRKVHNVYSNLISNPFYDPDSRNTITSKSFIKGIDKIVNTSFQNDVTYS
ncbi:Sedlin [Neocallimastix lanati (nom. inval.)]|nr:Sedlin [Neocallimastix sp. JGI-2020a]